ncbi:2-hydroxyglutaryl-CoA dehydratase [Candidatus Bipolaricaulota bacterium]|nr:2-hydroxyglutaryl-CoA dehydratase [Candidatus Bipolaricaulota bacterium]
MNDENARWIGIDVGSITCKVAVIDGAGSCVASVYQRTCGQVVEAVKRGLTEVSAVLHKPVTIAGCGTTGSARQLVGALVNADVVKNEITAHVRGARHLHPDARTLLEIGGEDSKIILLRNGIPVDFAMNTVCAAGTGAFLDQLAGRLGIRVEDLGALATQSTHDVAIAGRCTVFAESDIIFKQQTGHRIEDILAGACRALARNYLNDVAKGKSIQPPVLLLGGVAANVGIRHAFEDALGVPIIVVQEHNVTGAIGAALLAKDSVRERSSMHSLAEIAASDFQTGTFVCNHCSNSCEIVRFIEGNEPIGTIGGRCERWTSNIASLAAGTEIH